MKDDYPILSQAEESTAPWNQKNPEDATFA